METIPTREDNPTGLHRRYRIWKLNENGNVLPVDEGSEYFVLRLDTGGSDPEHIKACRIAAHAYADAIEHHLPELARDLRERYPLIH